MNAWLWVDAVIMLASAVLLVAGVGAAALWIAIIAVGVVLVILISRHGGTPAHR